MSLSDYEKEVLESLEQQFEPKSKVVENSVPSRSNPKPKLMAKPRKIAVSILLVLLGLLLLLVGVHYGIGWGTLIGIMGFLVILGGAILPFGVGRYEKNNKN